MNTGIDHGENVGDHEGVYFNYILSSQLKEEVKINTSMSLMKRLDELIYKSVITQKKGITTIPITTAKLSMVKTSIVKKKENGMDGSRCD